MKLQIKKLVFVMSLSSLGLCVLENANAENVCPKDAAVFPAKQSSYVKGTVVYAQNMHKYYECNIAGWCAVSPNGAGAVYAPGATPDSGTWVEYPCTGGVTPPPPVSSKTKGHIYFHTPNGVQIQKVTDPSVFDGNMVLDGGKFNNLILSNYIAGAMLGHLIKEEFPTTQFNKDYLYGMVFGQLLQENIATNEYYTGGPLIDPSPEQSSVFGTGQGGPYQINSYASDLVGNGKSALVNYVAIQKNIGYTVSEGSAQGSKKTPDSFNNQYYSPMLTAFFHFNDLVINQPSNFNQCLTALQTNLTAPLDVLLSYSYNQGQWGALVTSGVNDCINMSSDSFNTKYYSYNTAEGDSYHQYPYQVHYFLDQIYNNKLPIPSSDDHVVFNMQTMESVFVDVFTKLSYPKDKQTLLYINSSDAKNAFDLAVNSVGLNMTQDVDLSTKTDRAKIFSVLDTAISNLENTLKGESSMSDYKKYGFALASKTEIAPTPPLPNCPANLKPFQENSNYKGGSLVIGSDKAIYSCKSDQLSAWCNAGGAYAPTTGSAWSSAWDVYSCKQPK